MFLRWEAGLTNSISGSCGWRLVYEKNSTGITLLRALTDSRIAVLPDEIFGEPVTALGPYALAVRGPEPVGERLEITCGSSLEEADNTKLQDLRLPSGLLRTDKYTFKDCRQLTVLRFTGTLSEFGPGSFMNCRELRQVEVFGSPEQSCPALAELIKTCTGEFTVSFRSVNTEAEFVFPEYLELVTENEPTHFFNYTIQGGGLPYHRLFEQNRLFPAKYDALWQDLITGGRGEDAAVRMALARVRYPFQLAEGARRQYLDYLEAHFAEAAGLLLERRDRDGLRLLLESCRFDGPALEQVLARSRELERTEFTALLLAEQHRRFSDRRAKRFTL